MSLNLINLSLGFYSTLSLLFVCFGVYVAIEWRKEAGTVLGLVPSTKK